MDDIAHNGDPASEPTQPQLPRRNDVYGRLDRLEREDVESRAEVRELSAAVRALLKKLGEDMGAREKALAEVRAARWQRVPVWIATAAWVAIASAVVWTALHASGVG